MKIKFLSTILSFLLIGIILNLNCKKEKENKIPTIATSLVTSITSNSAISGGSSINSNDSPITLKGVCWSLEQNPTINSSHTSDGTGIDNFTSQISGLTPSTSYNIRSYATNSFGTGYGNNISFKTSSLTVPNLTTKTVSSITNNSAVSGGDISSEGGSQITAKGVCWSISQNPSITDNKTNDGTGNNSFTSAMISLQNGTTYHVRAYATNSFGTAYGNDLSFETTAKTAELTTTSVSNINSRTAVSGGNITNDGGRSVTIRGVLYSTDPTPHSYYPPNSLETTDGTGIGSFVSNMSKLFPNTKYYVRAYAVNGVGTALGNILSFTTLVGAPVVITTNISFLTDGQIVSGGYIADDGGSSIISRGVCWSMSPNPTISDNKTTDGSSTGQYTSILTGIQNGNTYYVKAYATNGQGTTYGQQIIIQNISLPLSVKDNDGNAYNVLKFGDQFWLGENLKVTKYNDGTQIPVVQDNTAWSNLSTGAYCWYNNDAPTGSFYGGLYNFYTVSTNKICPVGWHVPSSTEWNALNTYLFENDYGLTESGNYLGKSVAAKISWSSWNSIYTVGYQPENNNSSGFSGLAAGLRSTSGFSNKGQSTSWWTTTLYGEDVWTTTLNYSGTAFSTSGPTSGTSSPKKSGLSIRCIKD